MEKNNSILTLFIVKNRKEGAKKWGKKLPRSGMERQGGGERELRTYLLLHIWHKDVNNYLTDKI